MTQEEKTLILGALFHDIGKFEQRIDTINRVNHQILSSAFVIRLFEDQRLADIVRNHHEKDLNESIKKNEIKGVDKFLAQIICEADNLASGERQPDKTVTKQQPLESIFSKVDYGKSNQLLYLQEISELYYNDYKFPIKKDDYNFDELERNYKNWWTSFESEIKTVNKNELETLFYVLKKYLWCIPSSSYKTRSDVSLFEHSKITAAIAISMYRFISEKNKNDIDKYSDFANKDEYRYQLILADITGIQNFIYNIGHKGAAKALKGRSFYLQQMLENIAFFFLKELELPITNLIYSSGGKFYLFAPNTEKTNVKLEELQKKVEQAFLYHYNGSLGLIIGKILLNGKDLEYNAEGKDHPISEKWDQLNSVVEKEKKRKLSSNWIYSLFEPSNVDGELIKCAHTSVPLVKKDIVDSKQTITQEAKLNENVKFIKHSYEGEVFYQIIDGDNLTNNFISSEQFNSQKLGNELKKYFRTIIYQDIIQGYSVLDLNSFYVSKELEYKNSLNANESRQFLINSLKS